MSNYFKVLLLICIVAIVFLATTTLQIEVVENTWDKANHFIAFFTLYILLSLSFENLKVVPKFLLLLLFGAYIEIVQHFIKGRFFSLLDVVADSIGIIIGIVIFKLYEKYFKQASQY